MKQVPAEELEEILCNSARKLDYVIELGVLQEQRLCAKPVYKFERAYVCDKNIPEFCLVYSEADDPDMISVSFNSNNSNKFGQILHEYKNKICEIIFHGENGWGELRESFYYFYYDNIYSETVGADSISALDKGEPLDKGENRFRPCFRLLTIEDKNIAVSRSADDYLNVIFEDFIERKIWSDCGIVGAFNKNKENNNLAGYLAYYEIAKNIRDVSYIYVKPEYRRMGYAKKLLEYFKNKNILENKVSYYSYAENDISRALVESCGFKLCAVRYEYENDENDENGETRN